MLLLSQWSGRCFLLRQTAIASIFAVRTVEIAVAHVSIKLYRLELSDLSQFKFRV
jgi:hypothetical protein